MVADCYCYCYFSKPFVAEFYEFYKPLWLLVCCVCLLIVSTPIASMLGT